jgi:hypothetical protein
VQLRLVSGERAERSSEADEAEIDYTKWRSFRGRLRSCEIGVDREVWASPSNRLVEDSSHQIPLASSLGFEGGALFATITYVLKKLIILALLVGCGVIAAKRLRGN